MSSPLGPDAAGDTEKFDTERFDGKVAIVTGGANGMGEAVVYTLARRGARVVIADKDIERSALVEKQAREHGEVVSIPTDVKVETEVERLVDRVMREFGRIDILDNNAAELELTAVDGTLTELAPEILMATLSGNVLGPFLCAKHVIPHMIEGGGGAIVNMASITGLRGEMSLTAYGMSKAAIIQMTRMIATQYGKRNVRCNAIAPSLINTANNQKYVGEEFYAMYDRHQVVVDLGQPQDVAEVVAFLASSRSRFMNGAVIPVDGGMTAVAPFAADRREA
jgi:NAD(P)-dependent dehydrogenase (short-subunit alcohol dehydrogenase family)